MSTNEGYPQVGVERFELPTPCSQSMGQLSSLPSVIALKLSLVIPQI